MTRPESIIYLLNRIRASYHTCFSLSEVTLVTSSTNVRTKLTKGSRKSSNHESESKVRSLITIC